MAELEPFFFARRRDTFFCLSKIKYPNKKTPHTTAYGYPALLINKGVCGTRYAQTVLDKSPLLIALLGAAQGDRKPKEPPSPQPLSPQGRGAYAISGF